MKKIYTFDEVRTDYFQSKISNSLLRKLVRQGSIPHFRMGAKLFFCEESLDLWRENQSASSMKRDEEGLKFVI